MNLFRLLYHSRASGTLSDADVAAIATAAEERNQREGLTGMLCYGDGMFLQCLEGPPEAVSRTLGRIFRDPRHTDLVLIDAREANGRTFPDWGMSFTRLNDLASTAQWTAREALRRLVLAYVQRPPS